MSCGLQSSVSPHLIWVYNAPVAATLAATSRLAVTDGLRKVGWRVTLVAEGAGGRRSARGVEVLCIPKPGVYLLGYCLFHLRLLALLAQEWSNADVVLFHQMSAPCLLPLRLIRRLMGGRGPLLVMDTRDVSAGLHTIRDRLRAAYYDFAHRLARIWADGQTAITQRMADWKQIPADQLWGTWPSGVDVDSFVPACATRQWPSDGEPIRMVYVGALLPERNLVPLCLAVHEANARQMAFILEVVGDGPHRLALEQVAHQTGGCVRVVPAVPHQQIPALLAQAHVGVVSLPHTDDAKFRVSSPIKLFEYMAAGLPILATRNVCYTDVEDSGGFAFWAENPSVEGLLAALCNVWRDREALKEMGSRAAAAAHGWTWSESALRLDRSLRCGLGNAQLAPSRASEHSGYSSPVCGRTIGTRAMRVGVIVSMKKGLDHFVYRELLSLTQRGLSVSLFPTRYALGLHNAKEGWPVHRWNPLVVVLRQPYFFLRAPLQYLRLLWEAVTTGGVVDVALAWHLARQMGDVDVIYAICGDHKFFIGYFCKQILEKPLAVEIHAYELYRNPNPRLFARALPRCDRIITVTEHNKRLLVDNHHVDPSKIEVVRITVDTEDYTPGKKFIVLIVAFFDERKGHEVLFKAISRLARDDIEVWVVGGDDGRAGAVDVRRQATELGVDSQVAFFGKLSGNALKAAYRACDVFCLPCREDSRGVSEGFPTVLAEAMAFGKPVITTRHVEIPAIIDEIVVDENDVEALAEAIQHVYQSAPFRQRLGEKNRSIAEAVFSTRNTESTARILCDLVDHRS